MSSFLRASGEHWEKRQHSLELRGLRNGSQGLCRTFHACLAAENTFEEQCMTDVVSLMRDRSAWASMPLQGRARGFQSLAFTMLSSIGCECQGLLHDHTAYPWKVFGLLEHPEQAPTLLSECAGLRDPWSQSLLQRYDTVERLTSADAIAEIRAVAQLLRRDPCTLR